MIHEVYIDNYRCLTNFRIEPSAFQLWLGDNGSGKTSVLDALRCIQHVLAGAHVEDVFAASSLTAWDTRNDQTFGVKLEIGGEDYEYELTVEHQRERKVCRIKRESLTWKGQTFFLFADGEAHLFRIHRDTQVAEEGAKFSANGRRSVIPTVAARDDNVPLQRFRSEVGRWLIVQPIPLTVAQGAETESRTLSSYAENFAPWYRHVLQENPGICYRASRALADVLPGFEELSLREDGEVRRLKAAFRIDRHDYSFNFADLSDGQRQLIILYTILESLRHGVFSVLLIDEPDNFVSSREIDPFVDALQDVCESPPPSCPTPQVIIASHHPEIVNRLAHGSELWFARKNGAHVVTGPFPAVPGLTPAETIARGWEDATSPTPPQ